MLSKDKIIILTILFLSTSLVYAKPTGGYRTPEERSLSDDYKSYTMNKNKRAEDAIENELFGRPNYSSTMVINHSESGVYFSYYFYNVNDDNLCLGVSAHNELQDDAVIYVNTKMECGAKCKVYLDKPDEKQIFYTWEPLKEIMADCTKEKITIKTDKKNYTIFVRSGIKELELFASEFIKVKSIKGLEKFPNLENLSLIGFDY